MSIECSRTPDGYPTTTIGLDRTPEKALWGHEAEICRKGVENITTGPVDTAMKGVTIAAPRTGAASNGARPNPNSQEQSNEEGLFMAPKPPQAYKMMSQSAPEMWQLKHGPPPKRPRFRPVNCFQDPDPLDLPEPDVPMSGPDHDAKMASSCPAYVAFCQNDGAGLGRFGVPGDHVRGSPTVLEGLDAMTLGSIDEGMMEGNGWDSSSDDDRNHREQEAMDEDEGSRSPTAASSPEEDGDVFSFD